MCNPLAIIGGVVQGIGAARQRRAEARNQEMQAQLSEQQAQQQKEVAHSRAETVMRNAYRVGGQQRAAAAEGGLAMTGSTVDVMDDTADEADRDVQMILWNSQAYIDNKKFEAGVYRSNASSARSSAPFAFLAPVLNTAARFPEAFGS